jgi:hypothetical protein
LLLVIFTLFDLIYRNSFDDLMNLPAPTGNLVLHVLERLEQKHGQVLTSTALGLMSFSVAGENDALYNRSTTRICCVSCCFPSHT